jgi:thioredoxin reductase
MTGVELSGGRAWRFDGLQRTEIAQWLDRWPGEALVPTPTFERCKSCHREVPSDPASRCFAGGHRALGDERPTLCFDEHRDPGGATTRRVVAALAREAVHEQPLVAAKHAAADQSTRRRPGFGVMGWAAIVFTLTAGGVAGVGMMKRRRRTPAAPHVTRSDVRPPAVIRLPQIDASTCIGCSACVDACAYDVIEVRNFVAHVARPGDCCGLTTCAQRCPNGSLTIAGGSHPSGALAVRDSLELEEAPGIYVAGDLTGLPLIRNAINQGAHAIDEIAERIAAAQSVTLTGSATTPYDVLVVGAGPAGFSAALRAKQRGLRYVVLERETIAHSIRSFPRGKLVFDQPLNVPLVGDVWFAEATKEELIAKWQRIVRRERPEIREHHGVVAIERLAWGFEVTARRDGQLQVFAARHVLVATGRRGSPRKLPIAIPERFCDRVHYHLVDAHSFQGQRIVVVGLGDVAMEAALGLAEQRGTEVTIVHRGESFSRGKQRNIERVQQAWRRGRLDLRFGSTIEAVEKHLTLRRRGELEELEWDAVFVMVGSDAPPKLWANCVAPSVAETQTSAPESSAPDLVVRGR